MEIELKTQEQINEDMLQNISDEYEKSTGFLTADLVKSEAIELENVYKVIEQLINMVDVDKLTEDELTKYVLQRKGIIRKEATYAKVDLTVNGTGTINIGDLFATATNIQFKSLETKNISGNGIIKAQAVIAGTDGNVGANTIISMPITIQGITSVNNDIPSYGGFNAESDESLRNRYYEALKTPATSGNVYHYLQWAKSVQGVGNAKIVSLWNGANTVKIIIIDSDMKPASQDIIDAVQNYIDPKGENNITLGTGKGQAPIGAYCTVVSATGLPINVNVDITLLDGFVMDTVINSIKENLTSYFKSIAFNQNYVSYAKIGSIILDTEGVKDYTTLTVNGGTSSINVNDEEVAVIGTLNVS